MKNRTQARRPGRLALAAVFAATLGLAGCDDLLVVEDPERLTEEQATSADALPGVITGAVGDFVTAFGSGLNDGYVPVSALLTDEFQATGTFTTRIRTDRRAQFDPANGNTSDGAYVALQQARRALKDASALALEVAGSASDDFVLTKSLEAYTYIALGEGFCSLVPIADRNPETNEFTFTPPLSSRELLQEAVDRFNEVIAGGADDEDVWLARVGLGRALVDLEMYDSAATVVAPVDTDFLHFLFYSETAHNNPIFSLQANGRYSQAPTVSLEEAAGTVPATGEGTNGINFRDGDPRTPFTYYRAGFDRTFRTYLSLKHTTFSEPIVLASGVEARLIEAEAALNDDADFSDMTAILNALRADGWTLMFNSVPRFAQFMSQGAVEAALSPLAVPGSRDAAIDQLFNERARWLYLTGHRLGDLRRLVYADAYDRAQEDVYPTGTHHKGSPYGDDVVFPLDFDEENNTEFVDAGGHQACDVTNAELTLP